MWAEQETAAVYGDETATFPVLVEPQVDGITANLYVDHPPLVDPATGGLTSPVRLGQGIRLRGSVWLVAVVRQLNRTGTILGVSQCNQTGVLIRRRPIVGAYGHTFEPVGDPVPFAGVWRIMTTQETPAGATAAANMMPVGGWDWPGGANDLLRLDDGTEWEQYGAVMSDRTALSMVLSGTAVIQARHVPLLGGHDGGA
ncbi:MAG: hypothetical protein LBI33_12905 [Propionibacteriaceae bacterium]|jgi:hypothetical protein|nr:hypothetical protein [Propionibacteriaceae bacterium]